MQEECRKKWWWWCLEHLYGHNGRVSEA